MKVSDNKDSVYSYTIYKLLWISVKKFLYDRYILTLINLVL